MNPMKRIAALLLAGCLTTPVAWGENWPQWRGPRGDGVCREGDAPLTWSDSENIRWRTALPGAGHSSPIVFDDLVFVTAADQQRQTRHVLAIERSSGRILWNTTVAVSPIEPMHSDNSAASATPATDGERVYAAFCVDQKIMVCGLNFQGELLWKTFPGTFASQHGFCTALVSASGKLIVSGLQDGEDAFVAALSCRDGEVLWKTPRREKIRSFSAPLLTTIAGREAVLLSGAAETVAYETAEGRELWSVEGPASKTVSSIVLDEEGRFAFVAGGRDQRMFALRVDPQAEQRVAWESRHGVPYVNSPLCYDGVLHLVSDEGVHRALRPEDGKVWSTRRVGRRVSASMIGVNGRVYITDVTGRTTILVNSPDSPQVAVNELGESVVASPAAADGDLLLRGKEHLFLIR